MGLDLQQTKRGRALRLTLENTGQVNLGVLVGWNEGRGALSYDFQFHLKDRKTTDEYMFGGYVHADPPGELVPIAYGLVLPIILRLDSGSSQSLVFALDDFWKAGKGAPRDLDLRVRSSELDVRLKVDEREVNSSTMGGVQPMKDGRYWVGDLTGTITG